MVPLDHRRPEDNSLNNGQYEKQMGQMNSERQGNSRASRTDCIGQTGGEWGWEGEGVLTLRISIAVLVSSHIF